MPRIPAASARRCARLAPDATAFPHRRPEHDFGILSLWREPADDESNIEWTREFYQSMAPFLEKNVYVNNLGEEGEERVRAAYGCNYERLLAVKRKYDPSNFFHHNQSINPAAPPARGV